MTVCKSELKQCNGILIFTVKIILNMKILHCSPRNANTALLSNHSASLLMIHEGHSKLSEREYHSMFLLYKTFKCLVIV